MPTPEILSFQISSCAQAECRDTRVRERHLAGFDVFEQLIVVVDRRLFACIGIVRRPIIIGAAVAGSAANLRLRKINISSAAMFRPAASCQHQHIAVIFSHPTLRLVAGASPAMLVSAAAITNVSPRQEWIAHKIRRVIRTCNLRRWQWRHIQHV
jgi:hypothetical protein